MAQLSRPYQIALVALLGLVMVWFVALRPHGASSPESSSSAPTAPAKSVASSPAAPTPVYHGSAPGVEGLTHDIRKAHETVASSQQSAKQVEGESAETGSAQTSSANTTPPTSSAQSSSKPSVSTPAATDPVTTTPKSAGLSGVSGRVEAELKRGQTVLLLFWNRKSVDDLAVHKQLMQAAHQLGSKVAIHQASADQIGEFGPITQNVHVYQTPTILIINRHELVSTLTGFTDSFVIKQAVSEAQRRTG
jgi:hypothetical protein